MYTNKWKFPFVTVSAVSARTYMSTTVAVQSSGAMPTENNNQATTSATLKSDVTPNVQTSPSTLNIRRAFLTEPKGSLAQMTSPAFDPTKVTYDSSVRLDLNPGWVYRIQENIVWCMHVSCVLICKFSWLISWNAYDERLFFYQTLKFHNLLSYDLV